MVKHFANDTRKKEKKEVIGYVLFVTYCDCGFCLGFGLQTAKTRAKLVNDNYNSPVALRTT